MDIEQREIEAGPCNAPLNPSIEMASPGKPRGVMECHRQADETFKCKMVDGVDALSVGVATSREILQLDAEVKARIASN